MTNTSTITPTWREARATEHELTVAAINDLLDHLDNVTNALEDDPQVGATARSFAGLLRTRRNDLKTHADRLRTPDQGEP